MSTYSEASQFKAQLTNIVNDVIVNHPLIKSAIKAQKAVIWGAPNTTAKTIPIKFLGDIFSENDPYNPQIESYLVSATARQTTVSVWYNQSINNGIVMQNGDWSI